jgi:hypothetical protein
MSGNVQLSRITPYVQRLLQDEYVQDQIGQAITELRRSGRRANGRGATEALKDRRLRQQLSGAAGSLTNAARALRQPEPPKRHLVRRGLLLGAAVGGVAWTLRSKSTR